MCLHKLTENVRSYRDIQNTRSSFRKHVAKQCLQRGSSVNKQKALCGWAPLSRSPSVCLSFPNLALGFLAPKVEVGLFGSGLIKRKKMVQARAQHHALAPDHCLRGQVRAVGALLA